MPLTGGGKKRKATSASASNAKENGASAPSDSTSELSVAASKKAKLSSASAEASPSATAAAAADDGYESLTLAQIRVQISQLGRNVPAVPPAGLDPSDGPSVRRWAQSLQAVIEEFNLLLCCVSAATYKWGSDRSGAADQNLGCLSSELGNAQDQISSSVTPRLTNVLAPVVDLVVKRTVTTKKKKETCSTTQTEDSAAKKEPDNEEKNKKETNGGGGSGSGVKDGEEGDKDEDEEEVEVKVNHFSREQVDPDFVRLCNEILCRNAQMLRQVVLANFHKIDSVIGDYEKATTKDAQHDHDRGFAY